MTISPILSVPVRTMVVAIGPREGSSSDSMMVPSARRSGSALSSDTSATRRMCSSRSFSPAPVLADTGTAMTSPPHSSIMTSRSDSCCLARSGLASGRSILLIATIMGTPAALAWSIASSVWGITPSSAATTKRAMSVALAPRARMAVNASCPGVSTKVIFLPSISTW